MMGGTIRDVVLISRAQTAKTQWFSPDFPLLQGNYYFYYPSSGKGPILGSDVGGQSRAGSLFSAHLSCKKMHDAIQESSHDPHAYSGGALLFGSIYCARMPEIRGQSLSAAPALYLMRVTHLRGRPHGARAARTVCLSSAVLSYPMSSSVDHRRPVRWNTRLLM